jgi:hypothetical protein
MKVLKNICVGVLGAYVGLTTLLTFVHLGDLTERAMDKAHEDGIEYEDAASELCGQSWKNFMKQIFASV